MHAPEKTMNIFDTEKHVRYVRSTMSDMPYGDPFSGTPYGQYNKGKGLGMVIGIVGSVVTMGAALPMLASASLATQIAGGVMMAGGVLSGVGTITGNKKLAKMGGILSLAGGIGAFASSATGGLGLGAGSDAVASMAGKMMESVNSLGINVFNPEIASKAAAAGSSAAEPVAGAMADLQVANPAGVEVGGPIAAPDVSEVPLAGASAPGEIGVAGVSPTPSPAATSAPAPTVAGATAPPATTPPTGLLDKGLAFMNKNPELMKIGAQAISGFASSANSPDQQAYIDALTTKLGGDTATAKIQGDILQYQANNMQKQVAMISASDPDMAAKKADYAAKGIPVEIIPVFGDTAQATAWGQGAQSAAQTPTRAALEYGKPATQPATYGQPVGV